MHLRTSDQEVMKLGFGDYTCNWGTHICGLYENDEERDEIITGFLSEGMRNNDFQILIPPEDSEVPFNNDYYKRYPSLTEGINDCSKFSIVNPVQFYFPDGQFDMKRMIDSHNTYFKESQSKGKRNIRATAEMTWALKKMPGIEHLMAYEATLNNFFPGKPWISICMYNINKFPGKLIMHVIRTHPYIITGGVITANPFYIDPDVWLSKYSTVNTDNSEF